MTIRWALCVALLAGLLPTARADLREYLKKEEPAYSWKLEKNDTLANGKVYTLNLVSQTWQGITWEHKLVILQPNNVKPSSTMLLLNTGGSPTGAMQFVGLELTKRIG